MRESGEADEAATKYYMSILNTFMDRLSKNKFVFRKNFMEFIHHTIHVLLRRDEDPVDLRARVFSLMEINTRLVLEKLKQMAKTEDNPNIKKIMSEYEFRLSMYQRGKRYDEFDKKILLSVFSYGFQIERDSIHTMLEMGRISRESAKEMRHNISLLEIQLRKEYF